MSVSGAESVYAGIVQVTFGTVGRRPPPVLATAQRGLHWPAPTVLLLINSAGRDFMTNGLCKIISYWIELPFMESSFSCSSVQSVQTLMEGLAVRSDLKEVESWDEVLVRGQWWNVTNSRFFCTVLKYISHIFVLYLSRNNYKESNFYFYFTTFCYSYSIICSYYSTTIPKCILLHFIITFFAEVALAVWHSQKFKPIWYELHWIRVRISLTGQVYLNT